MKRRRMILGIPAVLLLSAVAAAADVAPAEQIPCPQGYPTPISAGARECLNGCSTGQCDCGEDSSWMERTSRGLRRRWFRYWQRKKELQHSEAPPLFDANWGYHPTCWRRFPPICNPCPIQGPTGFTPPLPAPAASLKTGPQPPSVPNSAPAATITQSGFWRPTRSKE